MNERRRDEARRAGARVEASLAALDVDQILSLVDRAAKQAAGPRVAWVAGDERADVAAFLDDVAKVSRTHVVGETPLSVVAVKCEPASSAFETIQRVVRALLASASPLLRQAADELFDGADVGAAYPSPWTFFRSIARWLVRAAAEAPALVVITDADRIDTESLEIVSLVAGGSLDGTASDDAADFRGVFVLGSGPEKAGTARDDGRFLAKARAWVAGEIAIAIDAQPFDRAAIATFLQSAPVLDTVWEKTQGRHGKLAQLLNGSPETIESLGQRRLRGLGASEQDALTALAVYERACPTEFLEALGIGVDTIAALIRDRFVDGTHALDFTRAEDRDDLLAATSESTKRAWHERIAVALDGMPRAHAQAAHHFAQAARFDDAERSAITACDELERTYAFGSALKLVTDIISLGRSSAALLDRALRYAEARGEYDSALRFAAKRKALAKNARDAVPALRDAVTFLTHLGRYDAAMGVIRWVKRRVRRLPDATRLDLASSEAELLFHQGDLAAASDLAAACRDEVAGASAVPSVVAMRLDNVLGKIAWQMGRYEAALSRFQVNLARAEESGNGVEKVRALTNLATVQIQRENYLRAEDLLKAAVREADACGDIAGLAVAHLNLAMLHHRTWDYGRAIDAYERAIALLRRVGRRLFFAGALCNYSDLLTFLGDAVRAAALAEEAVAIARRAGDRYVLGISLGYLGCALMSPGRADAEAHIEEAIVHCRASNSPRQTLQFLLRLAAFHAARFETDKARHCFEEASAEASRSEMESAPEIKVWRRLLAATLQESAESEKRRACDEAIRLAEGSSDRELAVQAHRLAGSLARLEGNWDEAERHALTAESIVNKMRADLPAAIRARFDHAHDVTGLAADVRIAQLSRATIETKLRATKIIARAKAMVPVMRLIERVAPTNTTVLVLGESGTGKELVAEALHMQSARRGRPLVSVNCAAIVETLLLSELFGHEKGAFTGAIGRGKGKFEIADGGTLFLDEIGDISAATQVALLRVLQEREFFRVGGVEPVRVDVRVVCATNRNLEAMIAAGRFREDLYYRLNCVTIALPPLRERREDIPLLANAFLAKCTERRPKLQFADDALDELCRLDWPGNVRQLENAVRSLAILADTDLITAHEVRAWNATSPAARGMSGGSPAGAAMSPGDAFESIGVVGLSERVLRSELSLDDLRHEVEMTCIARALQETDWNITHAASLLKMKRPRLSQIVKANLETLRSLQVGNA